MDWLEFGPNCLVQTVWMKNLKLICILIKTLIKILIKPLNCNPLIDFNLKFGIKATPINSNSIVGQNFSISNVLNVSV